MKKEIAIVVPTIREERMRIFHSAWLDLLKKHNAELVVVWDGDKPCVSHNTKRITLKQIMGKDSKLIFNRTDACRNLGFAYVAKFLPDVKYIISLDDDVLPLGDTIEDHIAALKVNTTIHWINTTESFAVRGLPYATRDEAPVMLSHGLWVGVPDLDAPSQLLMEMPTGYRWYKGPIPKGAYFPMCAMNFAFRREVLPYIYQAPMNTHGMDRFADIWSGISMKRAFDKLGWGVLTGFAVVRHERASNVFKNLQKEAKGLELNETFWKGDESDPYFKLYNLCKSRWEKFINNAFKNGK